MGNKKFEEIVGFVKELFPGVHPVQLHEPLFIGNEKKYLLDAIDSTYVSSVGAYVNKFEEMMCTITGASFAVAMVNGTNALHIALLLADVTEEDEVLSQSLTFIAGCNAIRYIGAKLVFIDVDKDTLGMSPVSLTEFLDQHAEIRSDGFTYNKGSGKRIKACLPMHTFGLPCRIEDIEQVCKKWSIILVEDAAESLGSYYGQKHTGIFGRMGVFSFNGNKTVTSGGGGALVTNVEALAKRAKHLTTQAKVKHPWEFVHDEIGYNYRMPNLNAALACAQLEQLELFVNNKRELAAAYHNYFAPREIKHIVEIKNTRSNYWLNCILLNDKEERDAFLEYAHQNKVMSRPVWEPMHRLPMFVSYQKANLDNTEWIADRLVNLPSSVRLT